VKGVKGMKGLRTFKKDFEIKNKKIKKYIFCLKYLFLEVKPFTPFTGISSIHLKISKKMFFASN